MVREMEVEIDLLNKTEKTIIDKDHIESLEMRLEDNIKIHTLQKNDLEIEKLKQYGNLKEMSETSFEKKTRSSVKICRAMYRSTTTPTDGAPRATPRRC